MTVSSVFVIVGLTYGDEGKGTTVDYLTKEKEAQLIVRFNGGPQAAHFVVRDDGAVHCFAQFGAGTLSSPTVKTLHSRFMLVEPFRLENEAEFLEELGVVDPLQRVFIDLSSYVITPYHMFINRLLEKQRGKGKHGSCGMGIGITAMEAFDNLKFYLSEEDTIHCLQVKDLLSPKEILASKLELICTQKLKQANVIISDTKDDEVRSTLNEYLADFLKDYNELKVPELATEYKNFVSRMGNSHFVDGTEFIREFLKNSKTVIFEGAQGTLLDTDYGFFPFNTATCCTPKNALTLLKETEVDHNCTVVGIMRSYPEIILIERRGRDLVPERHNGDNLWQDAFRVGPIDFVALKYLYLFSSSFSPL